MLKPFCPEAKVMDHASIIIIPKCIQTRDTRMMGVAVTYLLLSMFKRKE
jgi:hypothetical protein